MVEHGDNAAQRAAVLSVLHGRHGFVRVRSVVHVNTHVNRHSCYIPTAYLLPRVSCHNTDDYYANPAYFEARNMSLPSYEAMNSKVHVRASEKTRSREMAGGRYRHDKHCPATKIG